MTKHEILIHVIITAVISKARHLTDKVSTPRFTPSDYADWDRTILQWVKQSIQYCKYASLNQGSGKPKSDEGSHTDSGVFMTHSCQKTCDITVENGQQAKQSQRSSFH